MPSLFYKGGKLQPGAPDAGVLIWGHPQAYQDEIMSDWQLSRFKEECANEPFFHIVDMFASELTEHMENKAFLANCIKMVIGPKQTAKLQVTDTLLARMAKRVWRQRQSVQRRRGRERARQDGVSATLQAGCFELMESALAIQAAFVLAGKSG